MHKLLATLLLGFFLISSSTAQEVVEPRSGTKFSAKDGDTSLLGVGLRTKTIAKVKVYAIGLYVADSAISGPLKGKAGTPELYRELVSGDFKKIVIMKFLRDVSTTQIRDAFNESMKGVGGRSQEWINYFTEIRSGQDCIISWVPGIGLTTKVAGADKPPINDQSLASSVFSIWLGDKPVQEDLKKDLVSRAAELLK
jgi:Chalcone isomerase-like